MRTCSPRLDHAVTDVLHDCYRLGVRSTLYGRRCLWKSFTKSGGTHTTTQIYQNQQKEKLS